MAGISSDLPLDGTSNRVMMIGKISRSGKMAYTPKGTPILELELAVPQRFLDSVSQGYYSVVLTGALAEEWDKHPKLKIGKKIKVEGTLWARKFSGRSRAQNTEFKVLVDRIE